MTEQMVCPTENGRQVVLTTPNVEYNCLFPTLPAGQLRHRDHRLEGTCTEFKQWADGITKRFANAVRFQPIGT